MSKSELYDHIDRIVLKQGNVFIRELLRSKKLPIGANKSQFEIALKEAIDQEKLTAEDLRKWINRVEGWGNQHIYPFEVPDTITSTAALSSKVAARELIRSNRLSQFWQVPNSNLFPRDSQLTRVSFDEEARALMFEWHVQTPGWVRDPSQDIRSKIIDGDTYRFDAYREQPGRVVTRFVLHVRRDGRRAIAALLVRQGVRTSDHAGAVQRAWADLSRVKVGAGTLGSISSHPWDLSELIKRVDSAVVNEDETLERYQVRNTKLTHQRAAVQFTNAARGPLPQAIMDVRLAITPDAMRENFEASNGEFGLEADPNRSTSRWTRIQLYPSESRIRIGSELDREDVWNILLTLDGVR